MATDIGEQIEDFGARLRSLGYAPFTHRAKMRLVSQFAQWAKTKGLSTEDFDETWIEKAIKRRATCVAERRKALQQFLEHLRERGIASQPARESDNSPASVLERR